MIAAGAKYFAIILAMFIAFCLPFKSLVTGTASPIAMTGIASAVFPYPAKVSLLTRDGKIAGSALIGRNFSGLGYFRSPLSAANDIDLADSTKAVPVPYNANGSSGSKAGPTSRAFLERVTEDANKLSSQAAGRPVPSDLVTTSASGLDLDNTSAAYFRMKRVAQATGLTSGQIKALADAGTKERWLGIAGERRVTVWLLGLSLDVEQHYKTIGKERADLRSHSA